MNYNRPSGGYQKNLYRQKLNAENIKAPKAMDPKKFRIYGIAAAVVWLVITILVTIKFKWVGLFICLLVGTACVGGMYLFLQSKQKEMITYYKKIGMTEEMYIGELKKRGTDRKQIEAMRKAWRKVKVDPVVTTNSRKK